MFQRAVTPCDSSFSALFLCRTMFVLVTFLCLTISAVKSIENDNFYVLEKIKSGFQMAGKLFNSDHIKGVATLVSETFEKTQNKNKESSDNHTNIFSGFLRVLGFDTKKIGAITVNALIFLAQLISSAVQLNRPSPITQDKRQERGPLFDWILNNTNIEDILAIAKNENLSEQIIEYVKERSLDEDTGCIQLLLCKSSPFIQHMQRSIEKRGSNSSLGYNALFKYLPSLEEVSDNGDICEKSHPYCTIPV